MLQSPGPCFQMADEHFAVPHGLSHEFVALCHHAVQSLSVGFFRGGLLFDATSGFGCVELFGGQLTQFAIDVVQTHFFFVDIIRHTGPASQLFHDPDGVLFRGHDVDDGWRGVGAAAIREIVFDPRAKFQCLGFDTGGGGTEGRPPGEACFFGRAGFDQSVALLRNRVCHRITDSGPFDADLSNSEIVAGLQIKCDGVGGEHNLQRFGGLHGDFGFFVVHGLQLQLKGLL